MIDITTLQPLTSVTKLVSENKDLKKIITNQTIMMGAFVTLTVGLTIWRYYMLKELEDEAKK